MLRDRPSAEMKLLRKSNQVLTTPTIENVPIHETFEKFYHGELNKKIPQAENVQSYLICTCIRRLMEKTNCFRSILTLTSSSCEQTFSALKSVMNQQ